MSRLDPAARLTQPAHLPATPPQATTPPVDNTRPPSPPRMRSLPTETDGMDIDSGDEQAHASPRGVKRPRQQTNDNVRQDDARDDTTLPSTPPDLKRQRTETPPPPQVIETFSQQQHGELIALIQKHGGEVVACDGDTVQLALPPDTQLNFCVEYFCARHAMLARGLPFPGADTFAQTIFETTVHLLSVAALANQASLVRMLLATGLANQSGAQLRDLAQHAHAAGAMAAVDAITDTCAYWVQGLDPATLGHPTESSIQVGHSDQPPPDWQARSRKEFNKEQMQALQDAFYNADTDAVLNLLFLPEHRPTYGRFFMRTLGDWENTFTELLQTCGAIPIKDYAHREKIVVYSTDFDQTALRDHLLQMAINHESGYSGLEDALLLAATWGDSILFEAVWSHANEAHRRGSARIIADRAAQVGAIDIISNLLPYVYAPAAFKEIALSSAASRGDTATCSALISLGVDSGCVAVALDKAAKFGQVTTCAFLINHGAPIEGISKWYSPLTRAASSGHQKTCQLLIAAGARLDRLFEPDDASVLSFAAGGGNIGLYQYLLDQSVANLVSAQHAPPMVHAANENRVAMLDYLLQSGEDIERASINGVTPLMAACKHKALDAIEFLLAHGASVIPRNSTTDNAITTAIKFTQRGALKLLMRVDLPGIYWLKGLHEAIRLESFSMFSLLLPKATLNPLTIGQPPADNPLLAIKYTAYLPVGANDSDSGSDGYANDGSDSDGDDVEGLQPHHRILETLLREPQLPRDHVTAEGDDALMLAVKSRDATAVDMLVNAGLRIGPQSASGATALKYALDNLPRVNDNSADEDNFYEEDIDGGSLDGGSVDEDSINPGSEGRPDESGLQKQSILSNRILHTLCHALLTQPDRFALAQSAWRAQTDPTARDLALFLMFANSASTVDLPAMMAQDSVHTMAARDALMTLRANASPYALTQILMQLGVPSALHGRLRPLLSTFPSIRDSLFSQGVPADRALQAALDGLYLSLETEKATLDAAAAHYAPTLLDNDWKTTLTDMARQWLTHRIDLAAERQSNDIAPVFGDLFNRCAETLVTDDDYRSALQQQPEPGRVAARLNEAGVYASLANEIDAAWCQAWQQVSNSLTATDRRSNDELGDALLAAFRMALKKGVGEPSSAGNVITRIDAPAAAAQVYTDLMFQQLHMLQQFIHPEKT